MVVVEVAEVFHFTLSDVVSGLRGLANTETRSVVRD